MTLNTEHLVHACRFLSIQKGKERVAMSTGTMQSVRPQIPSGINKINGRINWCRFQQQLNTVTRDERAGWWAEEAGLLDAFLGRDRTTLMNAEHRSQFTRYLCGLHDEQGLLCSKTPESAGMETNTT